MTMDAQLLAFVGVAALLIVTPGPDMALVTKNAVAHGRRAALMTSLGVCTGILVHAFASAIGLSALLLASATAFTVVKLVGAAYLVALGIQAFRSSRRRPASDSAVEGTASADEPAVRGRSAFRQGFLSNVLNPKLVVFFLTLLPQFISPGEPVLAKSLLLAGLFELMTFVWLSTYSLAVVRLQDHLRRPRVRQWIERATGGALIALGARLAIERR